MTHHDPQFPALRLADPLPVCPHCGSAQVKRFNPDWIEAPHNSWECFSCGNAFVPEAWK